MPAGMLRDWIEPQPAPPAPELADAVSGSPLVAQILARRGFADAESALAFLHADRYRPAPAEDLPGMERACERIERAIHAGETICVWGDFDVDGQTATTLLVQALRGLGAQVIYHIPVRALESHGVNAEYLGPILAQGIGLLLTCDTGISSNAPLEQAQASGVDVIVTDHHSLPDCLPAVYAIVNPKLLPVGHPLGGLPGVGVAYQLAEALYRRAERGAEAEEFLDLAALGIVADVAEQTADTRWLLQRGLVVLRQARRTGLRVLMETAGLNPAFLTEEHIGFVIGPRMNALGRLDDANPIVEFLTTGDEGRARIFASHLEGLNARRRLLTDQVLGGALAQIERDSTLLENAALVLAHPDWPAGVIGIVASELSERFQRPTILLSAPAGQPARGSARSVEGVNITEAIASQKHLLLGYGGHPMAAGLSLEAGNLTAFRRGVSRWVEQAAGGVMRRGTLALDGYLALPDLTLDLVADLERLAPFGNGNPPLTFAVHNLAIVSSSAIGRDSDHLQIVVKDAEERTQRVIWWRGAGWPLPEGPFDMACALRASNYRGQQDVQVEWIDARPIETEEMRVRRSLTVIDQRDQAHPLPVLREIMAAAGGTSAVWAEAEAVERLKEAGISAANRTQLAPAQTLAIWTPPPGRAELEEVIRAVQPGSVILFAVDPATAAPEAFLKRLAGLAKHTIDQLGGSVEVERLAAASAQRGAAVRIGLAWLQARGLVEVQTVDAERVLLAAGSGKELPEAAGLLQQVKLLLEETAAFRKYYHEANSENIL